MSFLNDESLEQVSEFEFPRNECAHARNADKDIDINKLIMIVVESPLDPSLGEI